MAGTDEQTLALLKEIQKRKKEIARIDRPTWRTNCSFPFAGGEPGKNIQVVSDVDILINMAALVTVQEEAFNQAAKLLEVESPPKFKWSGFSTEDWIKDIKLRISKIQIGSKRKKLEALESRVNAVISPELRTELELKAIMEELDD